MSKKSCQLFIVYLLYRNGQDLLDIQYCKRKKIVYKFSFLKYDNRKDVQIKNYLFLGHSCRQLTLHSPCYEVSVRPDQFFLETYVASAPRFPFRVRVSIHKVGPNLFDNKKDDGFVTITLFTMIQAAISHFDFSQIKLYGNFVYIDLPADVYQRAPHTFRFRLRGKCNKTIKIINKDKCTVLKKY